MRLVHESCCAVDWYSPFLILNLGLDVIDGIRRFDLEGDGLSGQSLYEDLHCAANDGVQ